MMQFSIRTILLSISIACGMLGWMSYHRLSYQWLVPWQWQEPAAALLIGAALWKRTPGASSWVVAALLLCVWGSTWGLYSLYAFAHSSDGNVIGKPWMMEHIQQGSAAVVVWPAVAAVVCMKVLRRDFCLLERRQGIALSFVAVLSLILLSINVCFLNRIVRG